MFHYEGNMTTHTCNVSRHKTFFIPIYNFLNFTKLFLIALQMSSLICLKILVADRPTCRRGKILRELIIFHYFSTFHQPTNLFYGIITYRTGSNSWRITINGYYAGIWKGGTSH